MERSVCPFCGLGCTLLLGPGDRSPWHGAEEGPILDYDRDGPVNRGSLCARGNLSLELIESPRRLDRCLVRDDGRHRPATAAEAVGLVAGGLARARRDGGPAAVGILVGPGLTREEARAAVALARALDAVAPALAEPEDAAVRAGIRLSGADPSPVRASADLERRTATLVIGDLFTFAPCLSKPVLAARYDRRQNLLGVLAAGVHRTAWFAKPRLACRPGREAAALALMLLAALPPGEDRARLEGFGAGDLAAVSGLDPDAAREFVVALRDRPESAVLLSPALGAREAEPLVAGLAAKLAEATGSFFLAAPAGANSLGVAAELEVARRGHERTAAETIEGAATGHVRALLVLGADPLASWPGAMPRRAANRLDLLAVTALFPGETTAAAHVVLPAAAWGEKAGTVTNALGGDVPLPAVFDPPGGARPDGEILDAIRAAMPAESRPAGAAPAGFRTSVRFFDELDLHLRLARRADAAAPSGGRLLLARHLSPHSADGVLTRHLSWPRHEFPAPCVCLTPADAAEIGVKEGDPVEVGTGEGRVTLAARIQARVPPGTVLVPSCWPEVRRLFPWRIDGALGEIDAPPVRGGIAAAVAGGGR